MWEVQVVLQYSPSRPKTLIKQSRNKQWINFELHAFLRNVIRSHDVPLHPAWDLTHPFVPGVHIAHAVCPLPRSCYGIQPTLTVSPCSHSCNSLLNQDAKAETVFTVHSCYSPFIVHCCSSTILIYKFNFILHMNLFKETVWAKFKYHDRNIFFIHIICHGNLHSCLISS